MPSPAAPAATSLAVRHSMQGNRSRDTKPEIVVRTYLRKRGIGCSGRRPPASLMWPIRASVWQSSCTAAFGTGAPTATPARRRPTSSSGRRSLPATRPGTHAIQPSSSMPAGQLLLSGNAGLKRNICGVPWTRWRLLWSMQRLSRPRPTSIRAVWSCSGAPVSTALVALPLRAYVCVQRGPLMAQGVVPGSVFD